MKNKFFEGFGHDGYWGPVKKKEFLKWAGQWNGWCGRYEKVGWRNLYLRELRGYVGTAPEHGEVIARQWFWEPFDGKRYWYALYRLHDEQAGFDYKLIVTNRNHPKKANHWISRKEEFFGLSEDEETMKEKRPEMYEWLTGVIGVKKEAEVLE